MEHLIEDRAPVAPDSRHIELQAQQAREWASEAATIAGLTSELVLRGRGQATFRRQVENFAIALRALVRAESRALMGRSASAAGHLTASLLAELLVASEGLRPTLDEEELGEAVLETVHLLRCYLHLDATADGGQVRPAGFTSPTPVGP